MYLHGISLLTYNASGAGGDKNEVSAQFTIPNGGGFVEITHALNKFPAVQISEGTQAAPTQIINCKITYVNTTKVRFRSRLYRGGSIKLKNYGNKIFI